VDTVSAALGRLVRVRREAAGKLQEDVTRRARSHGLSWSQPSVFSLENGTKRLTVEELILLPAILESLTGEPVTLAELLQEVGRVELNDDITVDGPDLARTLTAGSVGDVLRNKRLANATKTVNTMLNRKAELGITANSGKLARAEMRAGVAEKKAARQLGVPMYEIVWLSVELWGRTLSDQRDELLGDTADLPPRSIQARRGRVTRNLLDQLRTELDRRNHA